MPSQAYSLIDFIHALVVYLKPFLDQSKCLLLKPQLNPITTKMCLELTLMLTLMLQLMLMVITPSICSHDAGGMLSSFGGALFDQVSLH